MTSRRDVFGQLFDFADVLVTSLNDATNVIQAQTGDAVTAAPDSDDAEWWQSTGFASRPAVPTQGNSACQGVVLKHGDRDVIIATRDVRGSAIYGNLADGESCVYASGSRAASMWKADGSITHATTDDNTATGNLVMRRVTPTQDAFWSPFGSVLQDKTGWHLRTWHGVKIDAGGLGMPPPFSSLGLSSSLNIQADQINIDGALVTIGRNTGATQSVVQALPMQIIMTQVATALADIQSLVAALVSVLATGSNGGGPVVFAGLATPPWTTAIAALNAAIPSATAALATVALASPAGTATRTAIA